ncbi:MAG: ribose 5-phosphate isomerase B [Chloroflexota bacterium]|nr:ribose 5-phosphate isomerase B [Chloroflexota bacterium]
MDIALASDHGGFQLKETLKTFLNDLGHQVGDFGTNSPDPVDYPDFVIPACRAVAEGRCERGIVICGTGIGACITANKVKGIRAALCLDAYSTQQSRIDNNANVLCLGGRVMGVELAKEIVRIWLETEFSGAERHRRRLAKIQAIEASSTYPTTERC